MRRRDFITLVVVAAGPFAARAEPQEHMRLIGVLMGYEVSDSEGQAQIAAFRDRLKKLGWTEDHNARMRLAGRRLPMRQRCNDPRRN